jgi:hypothetical protein
MAEPEPQSRAEAILRAKIDGETYDRLPQSRVESLLIQLNTGGGGGVTDYNDLNGLPTINGNKVKGEISDDILELVEPLTQQDEDEILDLITND